MSKKYVVALTIGLAIPTFVLSRVIWPDPPGAPVPPKGLLPFLIVPAVFESLAFGAGVAFLIAAGRGLLGNTGVGGLAVAAYASAGWALVSWWPHSNMRQHQLSGTDSHRLDLPPDLDRRRRHHRSLPVPHGRPGAGCRAAGERRKHPLARRRGLREGT